MPNPYITKWLNGEVRVEYLDGQHRQGVLAAYERDLPHTPARGVGIGRDPTPLEQAQRAWRKLTTDEREAFLAWIGAEGQE
jgi:hypothetical protein